jgi:hypothetical protein
MKRNFSVVFAFIIFAAAIAGAQPKVAVLDAIVQKGIDSSVVIPVTEKVIERLVVSGRYTVLDRANIEQVLREREFQLSGFVSDKEITEAGKYLGADFVVVVKVQKIDTTYFLSAKMIAVKTGVIANQSSAESEGKLSVLIKLAEEAGDILSGGKSQTRMADKPAKTEAAKSTTSEKHERPASSAADGEREVGIRVYVGLGGGTQDLENDYPSFATYEPFGINLYGIVGVWKGLSVVGDLTYLDASVDNGPTMINADVGIGYAFPLGIFMPWVAAKIGYSSIDWYYYYGSDSSCSAFEYGVDIGMDIRIERFLIGIAYQFVDAAFLKTGYYDLYSTTGSFWFMAGYKL